MMKASLIATLHSVTFTEKGAKVVLECSTADALEAARQVSKMTGGAVQAEFDDGQEPLFDSSLEQQHPAATTAAFRVEKSPDRIPFMPDDGEVIIVTDDDDGLDVEVIEEVD